MDRELQDVEKPLVERLRRLRWTYVAGDLDHPAVTGRVRVTPLLERTAA